MSISRVAWTFSVGALISLAAGVVSGQDYPIKPIRIITSEGGGSADFNARLIAPGLTSSLGQPVTVENRVGIIAIETVAKAPPDGYTLLSFSTSLWTTPLLMQTVSYDPVRDFLPITLLGSSPNILVVHPSLSVKSVKELIAMAKAKPGALNYGASLTGNSPLASELFNAMAGVKIVRVTYKGNGPAIVGLISGEVQVMFAAAAAVAPQLKSGKVVALAVTSPKPSALFPGLPTVAASGVPGYETVTSYGIFAPAKTPDAIIKRLNQEIVRILNRPDVRDKFLGAGIEVVGSSPEEFATVINSEIVSIGKVVKDAGIKAD